MSKHTAAIQASVTKTASFTPTTVLSANRYKKALIQLVVSAKSGTNPTLDVVVEDSVDGSNWNTLVTFDQMNDTGKQIARAVESFGSKLRARSTIGGNSPSFTYAVLATFERAD